MCSVRWRWGGGLFDLCGERALPRAVRINIVTTPQQLCTDLSTSTRVRAYVRHAKLRIVEHHCPSLAAVLLVAFAPTDRVTLLMMSPMLLPSSIQSL
eukprot:COSAG05_NODE_581_length_8548_cov_3.360279_8_plen_97_part_00